MTLPHQPVLGLIDGIEVLQHLSSASDSCSGMEIAKDLGIEKTKVNRILKTLAYLGLTYQNADKRYELGPAIHVLSAQTLYGSGLINRSIKHLIELTEIAPTVAFGVLWKDKVSYLYHWEKGIQPMEGLGRIDLFPATLSSLGLVLLSQKTNDEISRLFDGNDIEGYENLDMLMAHIVNIRKDKFAITEFEGKRSVAVSIGDPAYAALGVANKGFENWDDGYYLSRLREKAIAISDGYKNQQKSDFKNK